MKTLALLIGFCLATAGAFAQDAAHAITGVWFNQEKDGKIEIYENGGKYFGKLIWVKDTYEPDGKTPKKDSKNQDASLRNRPLVGVVLLTNFTYSDGKYRDGKIYDPKSGKTYSCIMTPKGNSLDIRGYIGVSMFGRTTTWTRP
ncbi:DUF2147 domain-containing protein [Chitinophaga sp. Cy-1792]|uniref:DUF2147 domain-containing protein n=1 Tax=Chitinophaga sp. Cy-1792 TaxID=2608339 RepID=UPI00142324C3|nr:DUF2147 domain-containing protein [Chitinophaga sp. Cy-1792]NIG55450.1 DUF2147 domain-containing protein [Chitinophaga sp. Cy-1792]